MDENFKNVTPYQYFYAGEKFFKDISIFERFESEYLKNTNSIIYATQGAKEFLRGYIKKNIKKVNRENDFIQMFGCICGFDKNFKKYEKCCHEINKYIDLRYKCIPELTENDVNNAIENLKQILDYEPIKKIRDKFSRKKEYKKLRRI